ncbi:MAG: tetratricopeptide repeat protein [Rhodospirillales bacterium]
MRADSPVRDAQSELRDATCQYFKDLAEGALYLGCLDQAALAMEKAVAEAEQGGPDNPVLPGMLNRLGALCYYQGKYHDAEALFQRAVALLEKAGRERAVDLGQVFYNLGGLYQAQGKCTDAELAYKRALEIWTEALGPDHPDIALVLRSLGEIALKVGRMPEAFYGLQRALRLLTARGIEDWNTLGVLQTLARFYMAQERLSEAEPILWRALELRRVLQGDEHPKVAAALTEIAAMHRKQGKFVRAKPLFRLALSIQEKVLGRKHPDFLRTLTELAELYRAEGQYTEAEPLFRLALAAFEEALGSEHPQVAARLEAYAGILRTTQRFAEAEVLEARARSIRARRGIVRKDPRPEPNSSMSVRTAHV